MTVVTLAMEIELYGGPADGMIVAVEVDTTVYLVPAPAMTPAEFIALEAGAPVPGKIPIIEHRYDQTHHYGKTSGKLLFTYSGSRRAR
jgi:hypothetical protein